MSARPGRQGRLVARDLGADRAEGFAEGAAFGRSTTTQDMASGIKR